MLIPEGLYDINSCKILPHKLPENTVTFPMEDSKITMLYNQSIVNKFTNLINSLFAPHTTNIYFRFEVNIPLYDSRIIFVVYLVCPEALFKISPCNPFNFVNRNKKPQVPGLNLNHFIFNLNYLSCCLGIYHSHCITWF